MAHHFFGKYRGTVVENIDPMMMGRIMAEVPAVSGSLLNFAMPCVPYAGPNVGFYALPPIGANVWIEFENGDPNYPIWSGCFWGAGEIPSSATALPGTQVFQTDSFSLVFSDLPSGGGFSVTCNPAGSIGPVTLQCNDAGVSIAYAGNTINIAQDSVVVAAGATKLSLDTAILSVDATELRATANAALVEAGTANLQASVNLSGALAVEGPTILIGGLDLTGGGTVDGKPLV